jgi:hypothetical protein
MPRLRSVLRATLVAAGWVCVATVVAAFFQPWARVRVNPNGLTRLAGDLASTTSFQDLAGRLQEKVGRVVVTVQHGSQTASGELSDLSTMPTDVTGQDIPRLAKRDDARLVGAVSSLLVGPQAAPEAWRSRSELVYLVPGIAVAVGLLLTAWHRRRRVLALGAACLGIALAGWWQLSSTSVETLLATVSVGPGLWLSCGGYAGLGLVAVGLGTMARHRHEDRDGRSALA